ncbi:MAG: OmpA family protein [Paludibacteraceae bacterium]|nr:OmpA family protein [Paludibacteraceae bacterium]
MKKYIHIHLVLLFALLLVMPAGAATKKKAGRYFDTHLIDVWGGAGYSGLLNNYQQSYPLYGAQFTPSFVGGGGGIIGFGYEYRYKKFLLNVGPEFRIFSSQDNIVFDKQLLGTRSDYSSMTQNYQFDKLAETQILGQVMLPIMFGASFDKFYFMAGGKVGYTLVHNWNHKGVLTTSVKDNMAYDPEWNDLLAHYNYTDKFQNHPLNQAALKGSNPFGLDFAVSAEIGINLDRIVGSSLRGKAKKGKGKKKAAMPAVPGAPAEKQKTFPQHFRLALFADYGLNNLNIFNAENVNKLVNITPASDFDGGIVATSSLHQTESAKDQRLNSLLVGVKGTWLLQLNQPPGRKPAKPQLLVTVYDETSETVVPMEQTAVKVQSLEINKKTKKMRKPKAFTTNKDGVMLKAFTAGDYNVWVEKAGYFPCDTVLNYELLVPPIPVNRREKPAPQRLDFYLTEIPVWNVSVIDSKTGAPMYANIHMESDYPGVLDTLIEVVNNPTTFVFDKKQYVRQTYQLHLYQEGYYPCDTILSGAEMYGHSVYYMKPIEPIKRVFILNHMYFAVDKTDILPTSEEDLQTLYDFLTEYPTAVIRIVGHTDSTGSDAYNIRLSRGRSASVKAEMVKRGIDPDRIETDGRGEREPIDTNSTPEGRQNNRRVEIQVLSE